MNDGGAGRWAGGGGDTLQWRSESATRTVSDDGFVVMYAARCVYVVIVGVQRRRCLPGARALRHDGGRQQAATARPTTNGTGRCGARGWRPARRPAVVRAGGGGSAAAAITTSHRRAVGEARPTARAPRHPTIKPPGPPLRPATVPREHPTPVSPHLTRFPTDGVFPTGRTNRQRLCAATAVAAAADVPWGTGTLSSVRCTTDLGDLQNIVAGRLAPDRHPFERLVFQSNKRDNIYYIYVMLPAKAAVWNTTGPKVVNDFRIVYLCQWVSTVYRSLSYWISQTWATAEGDLKLRTSKG